MPIKNKKANQNTLKTKKKLPPYFKNESGKSLSTLEKEVWKKIDNLAQTEIVERLNNAFRTSQLSLTDLNLSKSIDYLHIFEGYKEAEQEEDGDRFLLESYQIKNYQPLKYIAWKVAYEYLLTTVDSLLWSLSKLPFHHPEYFTQLLKITIWISLEYTKLRTKADGPIIVGT